MGDHRTRDQRQAVRAHMREHGITKYTEGLRAFLAAQDRDTDPRAAAPQVDADAAPLPDPPIDHEWGGHDFGLTREDVYQCWMCERHEVTVRRDDGTIEPCPGMAAWGDDPARVHLLLTINPDAPDFLTSAVAWSVGKTRLGRTPQYSYRDDGRLLLVESAPTVADELKFRIERLDLRCRPVSIHRVNDTPAVASIARITDEQARRYIAENYAAYLAKYGEPDR
ncbi:hypothetical protein [Saccharothrix sp. HUAS TT1]|uniref:hypothetical protein n=1 Tax=unclassified Saccharothrix TaxID=2593673 RepID=UPI00345C0655